jgi:hypothetical protein
VEFRDKQERSSCPETPKRNAERCAVCVKQTPYASALRWHVLPCEYAWSFGISKSAALAPKLPSATRSVAPFAISKPTACRKLLRSALALRRHCEERSAEALQYGGGRAFRAFAGKPPHHCRAPLRPHFVASYPPLIGASPLNPSGLLPRVPARHRRTGQRQAAERLVPQTVACPTFPLYRGLEFAANRAAAYTP